MVKVTASRTKGRPLTVAGATEAFLDHADLAVTSRRVYTASLSSLGGGVGPDRRVDTLDAGTVAGWFVARHGTAAPATWNRELATLRAATRWWVAQGSLDADPTVSLEGRREHPDRTRALTRAQIDSLWRAGDIGLREKGPVAAAVRDRRTGGRGFRPRCRRPGPSLQAGQGALQRWRYGLGFLATGVAQLLPRLLAGRTVGPVFLADRLPTRAVTVDFDPGSGRGRLSYRRAAALFAATPAGPCTSYATRRSPMLPRTAPTCRCSLPDPVTLPSAP